MNFQCNTCHRGGTITLFPVVGPGIPAGAPDVVATHCPLCGSTDLRKFDRESIDEVVKREWAKTQGRA